MMWNDVGEVVPVTWTEDRDQTNPNPRPEMVSRGDVSRQSPPVNKYSWQRLIENMRIFIINKL